MTHDGWYGNLTVKTLTMLILWYFREKLSKFLEKYVGYHYVSEFIEFSLDKAMESSARPTPDGIFRLDKQADYNNAGSGGGGHGTGIL